jgi:hypothetical protein
MRFCPPVTKLNVPTLPVRMGIGLSLCSCAGDHGGSDRKKSGRMTERRVLRRRADAVSWNKYGTAKPHQSYGGIVLEPCTGGNITEVMAIRTGKIVAFSWHGLLTLFSNARLTC